MTSGTSEVPRVTAVMGKTWLSSRTDPDDDDVVDVTSSALDVVEKSKTVDGQNSLQVLLPQTGVTSKLFRFSFLSKVERCKRQYVRGRV